MQKSDFFQLLDTLTKDVLFEKVNTLSRGNIFRIENSLLSIDQSPIPPLQKPFDLLGNLTSTPSFQSKHMRGFLFSNNNCLLTLSTMIPLSQSAIAVGSSGIQDVRSPSASNVVISGAMNTGLCQIPGPSNQYLICIHILFNSSAPSTSLTNRPRSL